MSALSLPEIGYDEKIHQGIEVLDFTRITKVPQSPPFMRGVINLRGSVVPVVDLKDKFGIGRTDKTVNTRIIICEIDVDGDLTTIGALADSVHEVMDIEPDHIEPAPKIGDDSPVIRRECRQKGQSAPLFPS